jgi:hypothetical protein
LQHIRFDGVLGYQAIGLQVHMPIGPWHHLLLFDPFAYSLCGRIGFVVDITQESDIDQLNILQLHEANETAYFHDLKWADDFERLLASVQTEISQPGVVVAHGKLPAETPGGRDGDILHMFEKHTPARLRLSFVAQLKRQKHLSSNAVRSPDLVKRQEAIQEEWSLSKIVEAVRQRTTGAGEGFAPTSPL